MTKYELAKLFGDVNDKFIEGAKPEAQSAVMMKPTRRSPIKIIAAASCAAVVLAGGVITANVIQSRSNLPALESSNSASTVIDNSSVLSETDSGKVLDTQNDNWFTENEIYYEGEYYKIPKVLSDRFYKFNYADIYNVKVLAGIRRVSSNSAEMVTVMVNKCSKPINIRCYGADSVFEMDLAPERSLVGIINTVDQMTEKPFGYTLQPGEMCFQKELYNVECGNYEGTIKYTYRIEDNSEEGFLNEPCSSKFYIVMTEDGFLEHSEVDSYEEVEGTDNWISNDQFYYNGKYYTVTEEAQRLTNNMNYADIKLKTLVGYRKNSENVTEVVTALKNNYAETIAFWIGDYNDAGLTIRVNRSVDDDYPDKPQSDSVKWERIVLQPGEIYFYENEYSGKESGGEMIYNFAIPMSRDKGGYNIRGFIMMRRETEFSDDTADQ